jgi:HEAT repeat protein
VANLRKSPVTAVHASHSFYNKKIKPMATIHASCRATLFMPVILALTACQAHTAGSDDKLPVRDREQTLIAVLKSDAPPADKVMACKRLAVCGSKEAVPALAPLLSNEQLASWARIALEAIPDPAAGAALRDSLDHLQGRLLVGAINSLGVRRETSAAKALAARLKNVDAEVSSAAAVALGRIGNAEAAVALEQSLAGAPAAARSAIAEGCILCAEKSLADGKSDDAAKLYDAVRKADVPKQRRLEATRGLILAKGSFGIPLLVEQLNSPDKSFFRLGLQVARELEGNEATVALMKMLEDLPSERQSLLLLALEDRRDHDVLLALVKAAKSGPQSVRLRCSNSRWIQTRKLHRRPRSRLRTRPTRSSTH